MLNTPKRGVLYGTHLNRCAIATLFLRVYVVVASISRGNLGTVWGVCLHQALGLDIGDNSMLCGVGLSFLHQALRTGLSSPFELASLGLPLLNAVEGGAILVVIEWT